MLNNKKIFAVIMAAGKGTRIGAVDKSKAMFEVAGEPIIEWAIRPFEELKKRGIIDRLITVVGFFGDQIIDYLGDRSEFVWQKEQLGTAHAVKCAEKFLAGEEGLTIIVNGDHPLYSAQTFEKLINTAVEKKLTLGFGVVISGKRFSSYGRVVKDNQKKMLGIVEVLEASAEELKIKERNINLYIVDNRWLFETLQKIQPSAVKKELYITEIVKQAIKEGKRVETVEIENEDEALGINTLEEKDEAEGIIRRRVDKNKNVK